MTDHRCDAYSLATLPGVTFCRKAGATAMQDIITERDALRIQLAEAERRGAEVAAQAEAMRAALRLAVKDGEVVVDIDFETGRVGINWKAATKAIFDAALAIAPSDALAAHDARLKKQWDEEFRTAWNAEHEEDDCDHGG